MTAQTEAKAPVAVLPHPEYHAEKYLTFRLGDEEFGVQVCHVREIMGMQETTEVPGTPPHLKGVINLRGKIIPTVDLRIRFGLPEAAYTERTPIVVVQVRQEGTAAMIGLVVDSVCEVLNIAGSDIEGPPEYGGGVRTPYVLGLAKSKGEVRILLDIENLLDLKELRGAC